MIAGRRAGRAAFGLLAAALCGCAGASTGTVTGAAASCAGPVLTASAQAQPGTLPPKRVTVSPGQKLRLSGYGYQTCHDTNHQPPARSFHHLAIIVIQGSSRTVLAHVSARPPEGTFDIAVQLVPAGGDYKAVSGVGIGIDDLDADLAILGPQLLHS